MNEAAKVCAIAAAAFGVGGAYANYRAFAEYLNGDRLTLGSEPAGRARGWTIVGAVCVGLAFVFTTVAVVVG